MPSLLIIDDDNSLRDALRRTLHKEGYTIMEADEGRQALKQLERSQVDLVLLDIFMPGKEGLETLAELRRSYQGVKVIAMSGGGMKGHRDILEVARLMGASRILTKPFTREALMEAVEQLLAEGPESVGTA